MECNQPADGQPDTSRGWLKGGRIYFTRETERRVMFVMTLIMLAAGILYKLGVW